MPEFAVPAALREIHGDRPESRPWLDALPQLTSGYLDQWALQFDGDPLYGAASLVLPVVRQDGTQAMLKLQPLIDENAGEALALRTWSSDDVVEVLEDDPATCTILLERLNPRMLSDLPDDQEATQILAELLARLSAVQAPPTLRTLKDIAGEMLAAAPKQIPLLADAKQQALVRRCAARLAELVDEPGDRLLHWDLHYDNVMAAERAPWLVIDPKPLVGDPGFDLFPALNNRWNDLVATGDVPKAIRRRFDLMVEVVGLDRDRAVGWTLGRVLQNVLWDLEDGENEVDPVEVAIARALMNLDF
ncbi:phosphotransferase [Kribbella qitaiheensis]|uniref:Phosphotransferase n=1 Tax=Kribbella qitaiheensis TaxID=1544730 RepID=A0A7G6X122_9ACTN|nr:aminoglycoside phosphotransferase family protein [Kribbella qitaiheensis]QNE19937.1 phosphotransferase [Kribbella qitaiheensis]